MSKEALIDATKTALDEIAEIVAPGETIHDLSVLVELVRDRQNELNLIGWDLTKGPTATNPSKFTRATLVREYMNAHK